MTISRTDLTEANGYILEEQGSTVIQDLIANSAVERFARREAMASRTKSVPRFVGDAPEVVAEGAEIPASDPTLDEIVLTAKKYAQLMHISEEDVNDQLVDTLSVYKFHKLLEITTSQLVEYYHTKILTTLLAKLKHHLSLILLTQYGWLTQRCLRKSVEWSRVTLT